MNRKFGGFSAVAELRENDQAEANEATTSSSILCMELYRVLVLEQRFDAMGSQALSSFEELQFDAEEGSDDFGLEIR